MKVHYFQHVPFEHIGSIAHWLEAKNCVVTATRFFEDNFTIPDSNDIDVLIVMGGPMGAYDDNIYPWLSKEKSFITACITSGKKVLGICLGAQLISACLGGSVSAAPNKEIGWFPVQPTDECQREIPWLYQAFQDHPTVFHWHGDKFSIPAGAVNLALTGGNTNQAFSYQHHILALQFHLECLKDDVASMLLHGEHELQQGPFIQTATEITSQLDQCQHMNKLMNIVLDHFLTR